MKKIILLAILAAHNVAFAQTPKQIISQFYPQHSKKNQCYIVKDDEQGDYCMKHNQFQIRDTANGKLMYWVLSGTHWDFQNNQEDAVHVASGMVGVFVLQHQSGDDWKLLAALPKASVGSYGTAPTDYQFREFGKNKWGFLTQHGDVHQGNAGSHFVIFAHDGNKKIHTSWLGASSSNLGLYGENCESFQDENGKIPPKRKQECLNAITDMQSQIQILKNKEINGFYPLQLSVSGYKGKQKWHKQNFIATFDPKKQEYVEPKNYPLNDIEY